MTSTEKGPKWKNEVVRDYSFDYVDLDEFHDSSCPSRLGYLMVYVLVAKSFLVYVADFWSAVSLLILGQQNTTIDSAIPTDVSKWIFLGAIMISFLLLVWDMYKSKRILATRDIAYAFTSTIANRYLSLKDYRNYCLFRRISNTHKRIDSYAFFVFFTLKGWKRLLLAEAPRQIINIVTLKALVPQWIQMTNGKFTLEKPSLSTILLWAMSISTVVFAISFVLVCVAGTMYIPLLCHIRGNLKEYVCHKVDKRIGELLNQQARRRQLGLAKRRKNGHTKKTSDPSSAARTATLSGKKPTLPTMVPEDDSTTSAPFLQSRERYGSPYYAPSTTYDGYFDDSDRIGLISNPQQVAHNSPAPSIFQTRSTGHSSPYQQSNDRYPYHYVDSKHFDHGY